jgi:hypothetical protein
MAMVISFHYFCLTLIQCSFNVALLNIGSDCNLLIKNVISFLRAYTRLCRTSVILNSIMKSGITGALINRK